MLSYLTIQTSSLEQKRFLGEPSDPLLLLSDNPLIKDAGLPPKTFADSWHGLLMGLATPIFTGFPQAIAATFFLKSTPEEDFSLCPEHVLNFSFCDFL